MIKLNTWLLLATALITTLEPLTSFAASTERHPVTSATPAHAAVLQKYRLDQIKSLTDGDPARLSAYYDENIRLMTESVKTVLGRANALSYHHAFASRFSVKSCTRQEIELIDLTSRVIEVGLFTMKLVAKSTGKEYAFAGKYLDIWSESEGRGLTLITSAWNYDRPLEAADALRFDEVPAVLMALQGHLPVRDSISFELAALNKLLEVAVSEHDATMWSLAFTDDAILLPNYAPLCQGRKALDEYLAEHVKHLPVFEKLDLRSDRIDDCGDYVIEYATHVANWKDGNSSGVATGKDIRIWQRAPNGALKLFRQIPAYD